MFRMREMRLAGKWFWEASMNTSYAALQFHLSPGGAMDGNKFAVEPICVFFSAEKTIPDDGTKSKDIAQCIFG